MFSLDVKLKDGSVLRVMQNRKSINLIDVDTGKLAENENEVVLEKRYCEENGIVTGDTIEIGEKSYIVTGIGSVPDYDEPVDKMWDPVSDSKVFGLAFVTPEQYEQIRREPGQKTEDLCYAYRLNGVLTHDELKDRIKKLTFDYRDFDNVYFNEIVNEAMKSKDDFKSEINRLYEATALLSDGMSELDDNKSLLTDASGKVFEAYLDRAEEELNQIGISAKLTADNYEEILNSLSGDFIQYKQGELSDVKDTLDSLDQFNKGIQEYTSGVESAYNGSHAITQGMLEFYAAFDQLLEGLQKLDSEGGKISDGAELIFKAYLRQIQSILDKIDYPDAITADNYDRVIDDLIKRLKDYKSEILAGSGEVGTRGELSDVEQIYCNIIDRLIELLEDQKDALINLDKYYMGCDKYTDGVGELYSGMVKFRIESVQLLLGMNQLELGLLQLSSNSEALTEGTNKMLDTYLEQIQINLEKVGYSNQLTIENYAQELDELAETLGDDELKELKTQIDGLKQFYDGVNEYTSAVGEAYTGVREFVDAVTRFKSESDRMLDDYFKLEMVNLIEFIKADENSRILNAASTMNLYKQSGLISGVAVIILFTYVISVFVVHQVQKESSVIGTMYALGAKKRDLIMHYIALPTLVTFTGSLIGTVIGFTDFAVSTQTATAYRHYSIPEFETVYPPYLIFYSVIMPALICVLVNVLAINNKLSQTALSLIRNEQKVGRIKNISLGKLKFMTKFQIRQMIREARTGITVTLGMVIALSILMIGLNTNAMCDNLINDVKRTAKYEYMYTLKYPPKNVPDGGEACYSKMLTRDCKGSSLDVTVYGIDNDNKYFNTEPVKGKNSIILGKSTAQKYELSVGDKIVLTDSAEDIDYAFTVKGISDYSVGLSAFMDIDSMRELFGKDKSYYNVVLSDEELDIDEGRLYSVTTREDIYSAVYMIKNIMSPTIVMIVTTSIVIICSVLMLMLNVMIDHASLGVSLVKIFGFTRGEIRKMYLRGNTVMVAIGAALGILVSKILIDRIYPWMVASSACGINLKFTWLQYLTVFVAIMAAYCVINSILVWRLNHITPAEVLRNRE